MKSKEGEENDWPSEGRGGAACFAQVHRGQDMEVFHHVVTDYTMTPTTSHTPLFF